MWYLVIAVGFALLIQFALTMTKNNLKEPHTAMWNIILTGLMWPITIPLFIYYLYVGK